MSRGGARVWGNAHPAAQLTEKRVIRYRELVRSGKATVGELAAREGCSHGRISMAVRGETWAHLNDVAPPVSAAQRRSSAKRALPAPTRGGATRGRTKSAAKSPTRAPAKAAAKPAAKLAAKRPAKVPTRATKSAAKAAAKRAVKKTAARGKAAPARKAARR